MAEDPAFATPDDWLAHAAKLFAERIADHLTEDTGTPEARILGLVATTDAQSLAAQIANGPRVAPAEPPERQALAQRLQDPAALRNLRLSHMLKTFELAPNWSLPLALLCVTATDPRFARLLGWLNDDAQRRFVTPALITALCGPDLPDLTTLHSHALSDLQCLDHKTHSDLLPTDRAIALTAPVLAFLTAKPHGDPELRGYLHPARILPPEDMPDTDPLQTGNFCVTGASGAGRRATAAALLQRHGVRAQVLDATNLPADPRDLLARALRDTALGHQGLILAFADRLPMPVLHWALSAARSPLALTAQGRLSLDLPHIRVPDLDAPRSRRLWTARLGDSRAEEAGQLAHQFRLQVEDILSIPVPPGRSLKAIRQDCLDRSAGTLSRLATPVPCRHDWQDLVLPPRQTQGLHSIVQRAKHARAVYDDWGFGRKLVPNRGLSALFSGPSGSGKTLSASIVARAIGLPLYRVDLSATVSKYIGETEKNLEQIFSAAESANACLLFDECDALFGKRSEVSDAHDRYANIETSYLLQRMEAHRGVVMMSSNHPQNIDEAFMRRIDLAIEFSLPDAALRMALWQRLMPPEAGAEYDPVRLGEQFELTGGSIRNCLVTAAFLATQEGTRITTDHCLRAVALEYEKTRRPLTRAEFGDAYPALRARKGG